MASYFGGNHFGVVATLVSGRNCLTLRVSVPACARPAARRRPPSGNIGRVRSGSRFWPLGSGNPVRPPLREGDSRGLGDRFLQGLRHLTLNRFVLSSTARPSFHDQYLAGMKPARPLLPRLRNQSADCPAERRTRSMRPRRMRRCPAASPAMRRRRHDRFILSAAMTGMRGPG